MSEQAVRTTLTRILSTGSVLGARLRPLLVQEVRRTTGFDPESYIRSFGKFSAFLAANADLVAVAHDEHSGDILVSSIVDRTPAAAERQFRPRYFARQLWQAFTNPDEHRRRFYHRDTHEVVHYLDGSLDELDAELAARVTSDTKFVEVDFARAKDQNRWMRDFLTSTPGLSESTRRVASYFVDLRYESSVNLAFASALGPYGEAWRRFRVARVSERIDAWADNNSILLQPHGLASGVDGQDVPPARAIEPPETSMIDAETLRTSLQSMIRMMNATELAQVLIPATVCARIARAETRE